MPNNWNTYKLEDLVTKLGDGLHGTPKYSNDGDYYFINGNNLTDGKIEIKKDTKRVTKEEYLKHKKDINENTLFVSINGTIGNVGTYNGEKVILGKSACYFNIKKDVDKEYIKQIFSSRIAKDYLENNATGTTIKNVSLKTMREFPIKLPPLHEQQSIASILSAIDDKIENNLAINKTLEEMAMALYKHWFVDFGPFKDGEFVESELGMIPKGWEVKSLENIGDFKNGKGINASKRSEDGKYIILGSNGIIGRTNEIMFKEPVIAIGRVGANYGEIHYSVEPCWISDNAITVQPQVNNQYWFIYQMLKEVDYSNFAGGSAQPLITQSSVKALKFSCPDLESLDLYSSKIEMLYNKRIENLTENQSLTELRDTLLPQLISGAVRLKEFRE